MIEVLDPGPLSSLQDAVGREGWRHLGVPVGGAADPWSALLANRLVGNLDDAALVEVTLGGAAFRTDRPMVVAAAGGLSVYVDGIALAPGEARRLRAGETIRFDPGDGARGYLAVAGGFVAAPVLGSPSTDLRTGFGGLEGRALRAGDRLPTRTADGRAFSARLTASDGPIRIVDGPHPGSVDALTRATWTVGVEADRAGVRLDGPIVAGGEVPSMGLPLGAIQVPPDGRPIVMLADRPVTGGYLVPACVIRADIGRVAQLRTGDSLTFASVSIQEARDALALAVGALTSLEALEVRTDDELGWIGSSE